MLVRVCYNIIFEDSGDTPVPRQFGFVLFVLPADGIFWISGQYLLQIEIRDVVEYMFSCSSMPPVLVAMEHEGKLGAWSAGRILSWRCFTWVPYLMEKDEDVSSIDFYEEV